MKVDIELVDKVSYGTKQNGNSQAVVSVVPISNYQYDSILPGLTEPAEKVTERKTKRRAFVR